MGRKSHQRAEQQTPPKELPSQTPRSRSRSWLLAVLLGLVVVLFGTGAWVFADWWRCFPDDVQATFVGRSSCVECHATEVQQWVGSDHDRAMDVATDETVLADFNDAEFTHHEIVSRMYRDGTKFMVHTEGPDGNMGDFEVKYVFGIRPLQQYMVEFDRSADMPVSEIARVQVLRITWDTEKKEWFYLPPPDVADKLAPDDVLHWTGPAQCWNTMCAYCHSTNLQKNFDVKTLTYHTTFSEIDVSCEACHGPASLHVELARKKSLFWDRKRGYGLANLKTIDTQPLIHSCAPCHARRSIVAPDFRPGDNFYDYFNNELLVEPTYYADGQILDEDYVFGSFIQSKMYHKDIRCTDCHNPHTARLKHDGNKVCTSCHQHAAAKYDTPAHHFHKSDSTGASCPECHMPESTYMEVDPRRDHSIRIPRPDLSVALGTPNACTRCHLTDAKISDEKRGTLKQYNDWIREARAGDEELRAELQRIDQWMLESMRQWYKKETWGDSFAFAMEAGRQHKKDAAQMLAEVATDRKMAGIVRATAFEQRDRLMSSTGYRPEIQGLQDEDPQVRVAAVARFYSQMPDIDVTRLDPQQLQTIADQLTPVVRPLVPLLSDPRRVVRAQVGRVLARIPKRLHAIMLNGAQRQKLDDAIEQYIVGVRESSERGGAHLELAVLYETMGKRDKALEAYRTAIRVEPGLTGPRSNLAALLDRISEDEANAIRQQLSHNGARPISDRMKKMIAAAKTAAWTRAAESTELRRAELKLLQRDAGLVPDNAALQYRLGLSLHLHQQAEKAEKALTKACELAPENDQFLFALALFYDHHKKYDKALDCIDRLLKLRPGAPQYERFRDETRQKKSEGEGE